MVKIRKEGRKGRKKIKKNAFGWIYICIGRGWNRHIEQCGVIKKESKVLEHVYYIYVSKGACRYTMVLEI